MVTSEERVSTSAADTIVAMATAFMKIVTEFYKDR